MAKSLNENIGVSAKLHEEIYELNTNLEIKIEQRTKDLSRSNKNIKDILNSYVKCHFIFWQPKDTVGGDIYFITTEP